jgi:hypothetical protein
MHALLTLTMNHSGLWVIVLAGLNKGLTKLRTFEYSLENNLWKIYPSIFSKLPDPFSLSRCFYLSISLSLSHSKYLLFLSFFLSHTHTHTHTHSHTHTFTYTLSSLSVCLSLFFILSLSLSQMSTVNILMAKYSL